MPTRPKQNVSLYSEEQVAAYDDARDVLEEQGVDVDELSQGEVLACLSREYVDEVRVESSGGNRRRAAVWDAVTVAAPLLGFAAVILVVVVGVGLLAIQVLA